MTWTFAVPRSGIMVASVAILVAACAAQPSSGSAESDPATIGASPTSRPSLSPSPPAQLPSEAPPPSLTAEPGLGPDTVAQVITTDLVQRSEPGTGPESEIYPELLNAPKVVYVVDGPVAASGLDWYLVQPFEPEFDDVVDAIYPLGWVAAAGLDGEQWIAPTTIDCLEPTFASLVNQHALARLACYGSSPITFEGTWGGFTAAVPGLVEPSWISTQGYRVSKLGDPHPFGFELMIHVPDGVAIPHADQSTAVAVEVGGHFDDPVARSCRPLSPPVPAGQTPPPPGPLDDEVLILTCRTNFVATSVEVVSP